MNELTVASTPDSNWETIRFRYVANTSKGRLPAKSEDEPSVENGGVPYLSMEYLRGNSEATEFVFPEGMIIADESDVLLLWDGSNAGEFLRSKFGAVSSTAALLRPIKFERGYLYWLCKGIEPVLRTFTNGMGIPHVDGEILKNLRIPFPKDENYQEAINEYLDRETTRIDALLVEKEKMLALLEEKRAAIISCAVTRGLDPDAPLKHSGFDWLGDIPEHWEIIRLKFFSSIGYGLSQPPEYQVSGSPFVRATNVNRGGLYRNGLVYVDESDLPPERVVRLSAGDLVVVRSGAYTGDSALVTEEWEGSILGFDMVVRVLRFCHPMFVSFSLLSQYVLNDQINPLRLRAAQPHLNAEELGGLFFVVPPLDEQEAICHYIITERDQIIDTEKKLKHSIELLKERRAALITAAVTGQISVEDMRA